MNFLDQIAKNPLPSQNRSYQTPMDDQHFEILVRKIVHETNDPEKKLEILYQSRGFFSGEQAGHIVSSITRPKDRMKAILIVEPRLIPMTCQQARNILATITVHNDRLEALQYVKRALNDAHTQEGTDYILSVFPFYEDKLKAGAILETIIAREGVRVAAGGHIGYGALGSTVVRAPPLNPHFYGPVANQIAHLPNHSQDATVARSIFPPKAPSIYSFGESYLPPSRPTDINAHYTSNTNDITSRQYPGMNTAPTYIYHATDPGPVGYANLQSSTAPNACETEPQINKQTHTYTNYPNNYPSTRADPLTSH
ncbi:unnamed protein product [Rotaria magnacalcarata]|uniref:DUF4476 domain-containing protein n=1 Tax=Rotaria magnacalcarata TaxID=392030 RepID=A0A816N6M2_9BILA|nr:unnamed protein product [Rotaria magnacalcarata]CAF2018894.1 unnamed protein product [Rotaria magnacalcarata]CAF3940466.1 unnamed protein product [Rotaria magnacalcarata]CAF4065882.1 unnamed protein product [Rotaria magnacalcarata]